MALCPRITLAEDPIYYLRQRRQHRVARGGTSRTQSKEHTLMALTLAGLATTNVPAHS